MAYDAKRNGFMIKRKIFLGFLLFLFIITCSREPYYDEHSSTLSQNRSGWYNIGIDEYDCNYTAISSDGSLTNLDLDVTSGIPDPIEGKSIEQLFVLISEKIDEQVFVLRVVYDEDFYYPQSIFIDATRESTNDQIAFYVNNFSTNTN